MTVLGGVANNLNLTTVNGQLQSNDARRGQLAVLKNGMTQLGPLPPTTLALGQVRVIANGVPAMYGDFVGGAVEYVNSTFLDTVTRRRAMLRSSSPFNAYHQNGLETFVFKPLIVNDGNTKLGISHSMFIGYDKDPNPSRIDLYKLNAEEYNTLLEKPFKGDGVATEVSALNSKRLDDFDKFSARQNVAAVNVFTSLGISWEPNNNVLINITPSIQYTRANQFSFSNSLFNSSQNPLTTSIVGKVNAQLVHSLKQPYGSKGELLYDNSLLSKVNYVITADYQHFLSVTKDPVYQNDIFSYGHIGKFTSRGEDSYSYIDEERNVTNQFGNTTTISGFHEWQGYEINDLTFEASDKNPLRSSITRYVMDNTQSSNLTEVSQNQGLLNGQNPNTIHSMWRAPGTVVSNFSKNDIQKASLNAVLNISVNPKRTLENQHDIQIGFLFEQRKRSFYSLDANSLWRLMPQLTNNQYYIDANSNAQLSYDSDGMFIDTVRYVYDVNLDNQSNFDKSLRGIIPSNNGYHSGGAHFIDVNELDPSMLRLDMFSANELWNNGSSSVGYAGYDYLGNKQRQRFSISDFLNDPNNRSINGHSPDYSAFWVQDKFVVEKLKIRVGVRVERYDANQLVLKDLYSFYPIKTAGEVSSIAGNQVNHPSSISDDAKVYVNDMNTPTEIVGYRQGGQWYNENGVEVSGGEGIRQSSSLGVIQPFLVEPKNPELSSTSFEDYSSEILVLPRLSFSFPVTSTGLFYAYYDKFAQRPSFAQSFVPISTYYYLENASTTVLPNASQKPTKRTDYQLGYKQLLGQRSTINLMAGYADIRDDINLVNIEQAYPRSYITYDNIDFSTIKKFQVDYTYQGKNAELGASYLLQFADGTGSNVNSTAALIQAGQPNLRSLYPLAYDVRHKLNSSALLDLSKLSSKKNSMYRNVQISVYSTITSGLPFTALATPVPEAQNLGAASRSQISGNPFGSRMPWVYNLDLSISKSLMIKRLPLVVQLNALNILNLQQVQNIYAATASATDDGYLSSPVGQQEIAREQNAQSFVEFYNLKLNNPNHFGAPRVISLTLRTSF